MEREKMHCDRQVILFEVCKTVKKRFLRPLVCLGMCIGWTFLATMLGSWQLKVVHPKGCQIIGALHELPIPSLGPTDPAWVTDTPVSHTHEKLILKLECGPMPSLMAALPNIGDALCRTPQFG